MEQLKALWKRLAAYLTNREPDEDVTSEYIPVGNGPERSAGYLYLKDYKQ